MPYEVEVWDVPAAALGPFVARVTPPLAIGPVALEDGSTVPGFVCQADGIADARDITGFGGWRAFRRGGVRSP
jgi:allophanate hydrolase